MALSNLTAHSAFAVEDVLLLMENSTSNGTNATVAVQTYPSGYTLPQIVVASIVVTVLMIAVVVGNMLVIIAIATEKALKNIQNWFIASLAVADFFLGLVIMPFSLANELMGYWIFGVWWCDVHSAMDVLLSTASIMNLCLISLDRYWSITQAVEYLKKRTPMRAAIMITAVWLLSALICIPPLLGWKVERPAEEQYPQCQRKHNKRLYNLVVFQDLNLSNITRHVPFGILASLFSVDRSIKKTFIYEGQQFEYEIRFGISQFDMHHDCTFLDKHFFKRALNTVLKKCNFYIDNEDERFKHLQLTEFSKILYR
ncbi:hypothetical protein ABEB36_008944 [Hypothenemus hampei]|uniref:G-protein coupled receptors family 1 profile domain-containing protein n=1 Tax=Hypothenemus hampei TaxID=57062 RepID=A0ABD1ENM5_HYPHA